MKKILLGLFFLFAGHAFAGSATGLITNIFTTRDDGAFIYFQSVSNAAGCGSSNLRFAIRPSTPGGKAHLANAMQAYLSGKKVTAIGTGNCDIWGDTESLQYLYLVN